MRGRLVRVNASWSKRHGAIGTLVDEERDTVLVKFGGKTSISYRFDRTEVTETPDMEQNRVVRKVPYWRITVERARFLRRMGITSVANGDGKTATLLCELPVAV